jgi:hypothetical protein
MRNIASNSGVSEHVEHCLLMIYTNDVSSRGSCGKGSDATATTNIKN